MELPIPFQKCSINSKVPFVLLDLLCSAGLNLSIGLKTQTVLMLRHRLVLFELPNLFAHSYDLNSYFIVVCNWLGTAIFPESPSPAVGELATVKRLRIVGAR
jgi:hypothetical protein